VFVAQIILSFKGQNKTLKLILNSLKQLIGFFYSICLFMGDL